MGDLTIKDVLVIVWRWLVLVAKTNRWMPIGKRDLSTCEACDFYRFIYRRFQLRGATFDKQTYYKLIDHHGMMAYQKAKGWTK